MSEKYMKLWYIHIHISLCQPPENTSLRDIQRKNVVNNESCKVHGCHDKMTHRTTYKHVEHQPATHIQKLVFIFGFICFISFLFIIS